MTQEQGNNISMKGKKIATQPEEERFQIVFASALVERLQENPELTQSLRMLIYGDPHIQEIVAERNSWIEDVKQNLKGVSGSQSVRASDDSIIIDVAQQAKKKE